jgi:cell division protein FtsL
MLEHIIIASIFTVGIAVTFYIFGELKLNALNDKIQELQTALFNSRIENDKLHNEIEHLKGLLNR